MAVVSRELIAAIEDVVDECLDDVAHRVGEDEAAHAVDTPQLIPVNRFRPIVEKWVAEFDVPEQAYHRLAANSVIQADTWRKRLSEAYRSKRGTSRGWWTYHELDAYDVDEFLTAAGLTHLWFTDLADLAGVEPSTTSSCQQCGWSVDWSRGDAGEWPTCSICHARENRGLPMGPWKRAELLDLYVRYVRSGMTVAELAGPLWQAKGYRNLQGATSVIQHAWKRNGWPVRRRGESKRLRTQRTGPRLSPRRKLSEQHARVLHRLHWEHWVSINQLARDYHERLGLTQSALCSQLSYTWKLLGLPSHDRIEMTVRASTKHGLKPRKGGSSAAYKRFQAQQKGEQYDRPCSALTTRGKPCRHRAMLGRDVCQNHAPERRQEIADRLAGMRQRSPKHRPENLTAVAVIQPALLAYFEWNGRRWKELAEASGYSNTQLRAWASAPPERRIMLDTVARIERGLLAVVPVGEINRILPPAHAQAA